MNVKIKRLNKDAIIPAYAHDTDSGFDLCAVEDVIIAPGETALVKTGIAIDIPPEHEIQVRNRSGITSKTKLRVQFGTIDEGYTGEIKVTVDNISQEPFEAIKDEEGVRYERLYSKVLYDLRGQFVQKLDNEYPIGSYIIRKGDRLAQGILAPIKRVEFEEVDEFDSETDRGEKGFGSSGVKAIVTKDGVIR